MILKLLKCTSLTVDRTIVSKADFNKKQLIIFCHIQLSFHIVQPMKMHLTKMKVLEKKSKRKSMKILDLQK